MRETCIWLRSRAEQEQGRNRGGAAAAVLLPHQQGTPLFKHFTTLIHLSKKLYGPK